MDHCGCSPVGRFHFCARTRDYVAPLDSTKVGSGTKTDQLNPKIRGWVNYHRHGVAKRTFSYVDHSIFHSLRRWARRRHPKKSSTWLRKKYYERSRRHNRCFFGERYDDEGQPRKVWLYRAKSTPIKRHIKVQGEANPYDPAYAATWKAAGNDCLTRRTDQTAHLIARSLRGRSGEATDRSKPSDNVPTSANLAPEPRGDGVSASIRRRWA